MSTATLTVHLPDRLFACCLQGAECLCLPYFGEHFGVPVALKIYRRLSDARCARARQQAAHSWGLAPAVGPMVRVEISGRRTPRYGYLSEQASPMSEAEQASLTDDQRRLIRELLAEARARGISTHDIAPEARWSANIGWLRRLNGGTWKPVLIDFGHKST